MSKTTLILLGILGVTGIIYIYSVTKPDAHTGIGGKGPKKKGAFSGGKAGANIGGKSGITANINGNSLIGNFLSGIFSPTNTNGTTETAPSQTGGTSTTEE